MGKPRMHREKSPAARRIIPVFEKVITKTENKGQRRGWRNQVPFPRLEKKKSLAEGGGGVSAATPLGSATMKEKRRRRLRGGENLRMSVLHQLGGVGGGVSGGREREHKEVTGKGLGLGNFLLSSGGKVCIGKEKSFTPIFRGGIKWRALGRIWGEGLWPGKGGGG